MTDTKDSHGQPIHTDAGGNVYQPTSTGSQPTAGSEINIWNTDGTSSPGTYVNGDAVKNENRNN